MKTLLGVFSDKNQVSDAIQDLREKGFDAKDISIVMKNNGEKMQKTTGSDIAGDTVSGVATGAIVGALAGLLAAVAIPGLGAFFVGGPIATSLGLSGAAATTAAGAATGAITGGIIGALMGFGLNESEAKYYESRIREGAVLIAIPVTDTNENFARHILSDYHASDIKAFTQTEDMAQERSFSRKYADMSNSEDYTDRSANKPEFDEEDIAQTYTSAGMKGGKSTLPEDRTLDREREATDRKKRDLDIENPVDEDLI